MGVEILLRQTPLSHPHLFTIVPFKSVRRGDVFQGRSDGSKWFENTDPSHKQSRHTYWRKKATVSKKPVKKKPAPKKKPVKKKPVARKATKRRR